MAAISSNGTGGGNWSAGASWTGGVPPGPADTATILAGDTITVDASDVMDTPRCNKVTVNKGGYHDINNKQFIISGDYELIAGSNYLTDLGGKSSLKGGKLLFHQSSNNQYNPIIGGRSVIDWGMGDDSDPLNETMGAETTVIGVTDANITSGYRMDAPVFTLTAPPKGYLRNVRFEYCFRALQNFRNDSIPENGGEFNIPNIGNITIKRPNANFVLSTCQMAIPESKPKSYLNLIDPDFANAIPATASVLKNWNVYDSTTLATAFGAWSCDFYGCEVNIGDRNGAIAVISANSTLEECTLNLPSTNSAFSTTTLFSSVLFKNSNIDVYGNHSGVWFSACMFVGTGIFTLENARAAYASTVFNVNELFDMREYELSYNHSGTWSGTGSLFGKTAGTNDVLLSHKQYIKKLTLKGAIPVHFASVNFYDTCLSPVEFLTNDGATEGKLKWQYRISKNWENSRTAAGASDPWALASGAIFNGTAFDLTQCANSTVSTFNYTPRAISSVTAISFTVAGCTIERSINGGSFADATVLANWTSASFSGNGSDNIILRITKTSGGVGVAASWSLGEITTTVSTFDFDSTRGLTTGQAVIEALVRLIPTTAAASGGGTDPKKIKEIKNMQAQILAFIKNQKNLDLRILRQVENNSNLIMVK